MIGEICTLFSNRVVPPGDAFLIAYFTSKFVDLETLWIFKALFFGPFFQLKNIFFCFWISILPRVCVPAPPRTRTLASRVRAYAFIIYYNVTVQYLFNTKRNSNVIITELLKQKGIGWSFGGELVPRSNEPTLFLYLHSV